MKKGLEKHIKLFVLLFFSWTSQGFSMEIPVTKEYKLDNGLKVVVREDHRSPVVVAQLWYKVGSAKEHRGITGVSHALEHMMFQGTPTLPGDSFAKLISQYGGENNAFTTEDFTAYYEELDAANLAISLEAEADRMTHLILSPSAFEKELQVIIEERRMRTDDNPQSFTWERFMALAHPMGPYHHPVIGWRDDLDHMTIEHLRDWYQKWYAPNNASLIVVGDVDAKKVYELAKQYFGPIPSRTLTEIKTTKELTPLGEKRQKVHIHAELPYVIWGYTVPSLKTADQQEESFALAVISTLLDGGPSARLNRDLIRGSQVAADIGTHYDLLKEFSTQFLIAGVPAQGQTVQVLEQKVLEQIEMLKTQPVSEQELQRAKTHLLAQNIYSRDSISHQAIVLGELISLGLPWQLIDEYPEKIKAITAEQIQQVAQKYFDERRLTVTELVPEKTTE